MYIQAFGRYATYIGESGTLEFGGDERRKAEEAWLLALAMLLANVHGENGITESREYVRSRL